MVFLLVSHHVLVAWRGGILLIQRPLQAGSTDGSHPNVQRAVFQLVPLVDVAAHRGDEVRSPQLVVVPAAVSVPNLETGFSVEKTHIQRFVVSRAADPLRVIVRSLFNPHKTKE